MLDCNHDSIDQFMNSLACAALDPSRCMYGIVTNDDCIFYFQSFFRLIFLSVSFFMTLATAISKSSCVT